MSVKRQLKFTARAFGNIASAEAFIAKDNPAAAAKVVETIFKTAERLELFPEVGKAGRVAGTRELALEKYPYTLVYRIRAAYVVVYAVLHQSRQYP